MSLLVPKILDCQQVKRLKLNDINKDLRPHQNGVVKSGMWITHQFFSDSKWPGAERFLWIAIGQLAVAKVPRKCADHKDDSQSYNSDLTKIAQSPYHYSWSLKWGHLTISELLPTTSCAYWALRHKDWRAAVYNSNYVPHNLEVSGTEMCKIYIVVEQ